MSPANPGARSADAICAGTPSRVCAITLAFLLAGLWATPAHGQTASQIAPESFAPPPVMRDGARVALQQSNGPQAPEGADAIFVTLSDIAIAGDAPPPQALAALRGAVVGQRISVAAIYGAGRALEQDYARRGEVLTRVTVPAQDLADGGTLRLQVVRGFIERVDTSRLPQAVRGRVAAVLAQLAGSEAPDLAAIERKLLIAGDTPGVILRSTLAPGTTPGATLLVIEADYTPIEVSLSAGNSLSSSLGRYSFGVGFTFNSVFGAGETLYLRANGLPNTGRETSVLDATPRNRALAAGIIVPIGTNGLTFNVEYTDARTTPRRAAGDAGITSQFERTSLRLAYPLLRSRSGALTLRAALDMQNEKVRC